MRSFPRQHNATRRDILGLAALGVVAVATKPASAGPDSKIVSAAHVSLAPPWFDPAETPGIVTPFMLLYALHDGLVKPMPGNAAEPCLAESYSASADGMAHTFVLRAGARFQTAGPGTPEEWRFSFGAYRGNQPGSFK